MVLFDDASSSHTVYDLGDVSITSRDDGGLVVYHDKKFEGRVAIFEAKRNFDALVEGKPVMSDERFGQLVGEALATRLAGALWSGSHQTYALYPAPPTPYHLEAGRYT